MSIKTRLAKVENTFKEKNMAQELGLIQVDKNEETGMMEITDRDKLVFSGSIKDGEKFIAGLNYKVLIIDDIQGWQE
ncbi:MAG: hypothetical protein VR69_00200 [Peptococcaceae bacterium BRH_c4b]|nr:MAG: hypothetical protein VR69_00200 [Peptococcaceae bacterium BRH_c4b]